VCVCVILTSFIFFPVIILITHTVNYFNNFRNKTWIPYNWLKKYEENLGVCGGVGRCVCVCVILTSFIFFPVIILITHTVNYFNNFRNKTWIPYNWLKKYEENLGVCGGVGRCVCVILTSFIFSPVIILITHTVNYFNNFRNKTWIPYNWLRKYEENLGVCVWGEWNACMKFWRLLFSLPS
jgi:hypothetical protein